jgi:hypothetical protein
MWYFGTESSSLDINVAFGWYSHRGQAYISSLRGVDIHLE